jgi:hypothetical protein
MGVRVVVALDLPHDVRHRVVCALEVFCLCAQAQATPFAIHAIWLMVVSRAVRCFIRVAWWVLPVFVVLGVGTFFREVEARSRADMMD